jgi:hypothetical protein
VIASRDLVSVFVDVSGSLCVCGRRHLTSLLDVVSSGLCSCVVSPTCSHHLSRVGLACLTQTALPSISPLVLRLFAASSRYHHHGSRTLLCFSSHRSPNPLVSLSSPPSLLLAKLHYDYPRRVLDSSKIEYLALAHSCLAVMP